MRGAFVAGVAGESGGDGTTADLIEPSISLLLVSFFLLSQIRRDLTLPHLRRAPSYMEIHEYVCSLDKYSMILFFISSCFITQTFSSSLCL
jgi:hypothetical protein